MVYDHMNRINRMMTVAVVLGVALAACATPATPSAPAATTAPAEPTIALTAAVSEAATVEATIEASAGVTSTAATTATSTAATLDGVKQYLLRYADLMSSNALAFQAATTEYYDAVKAADFDYTKAWGDGTTLRPILLIMRESWNAADNAYENVEGIVAGVPSLADYDVILDSGRAEGEGDNVAQITLKLPDGKEVKNPGSFYNWLIEPQLFGTKAEWVALKDIDVDGDGSVGFGDVLPEANLIKGSADGLVEYTNQAVEAIKAWQPTEQDAFQALVTMTPTMEEYFNNWKESRFVAGDEAAKDQLGFVAKTRLTDVANILAGINTIYTGVNSNIATSNPELAAQIGKGYTDLLAFADDLLAQETGGKKFTPAQAETLGKEAQDRAQALAGQVAQAAALLNITVEQ